MNKLRKLILLGLITGSCTISVWAQETLSPESITEIPMQESIIESEVSAQACLKFMRRLNFSYHLSVSSTHLKWTPSHVFDDGIHVYIQMPNDFMVHDAPALFLLHHNEPMLVNYRFLEGFYIVDQLFEQAELVLDIGKNQEWVKIKKIEK